MGELLIILLLTIANGVFAMAEAALISSRKARLQQRANSGDKRAAAALKLAENPSNFLATVQIGITLIGVLAGAFGGATIAESLAASFKENPTLAPYAEVLGFTLVVLITTYLSLIIGELVPKNLALNNPERVISAVAGPMSLISRLVAPLVHFLDGSTRLSLRLLGVRPSNEPNVTEEEIKVMIDQGAKTGHFEAAEADLVEGVFKLADVRITAIMTPRTEVTWLDIQDKPEQIYQKVKESGRSRFPVVEGSLDNVLGIVRAKDLLSQTLSGTPLDLRACLQPPLFVPETITALTMLNRFKEATSHIALVIDEYGGLRGIVTITDVLEEVVGGGYLSEEETDPPIVKRDDGSYLLDGMLSMDELSELLPDLELPPQDEREYETLGGYLMSQFGQIPQVGNHTASGTIRFEVVDMDGHRVDRVLVTFGPSQDAGQPD